MRKFYLAMPFLYAFSGVAAADVMSALNDKVRYLGQRQNIISHNISNANTPGYRAKDLEPFPGKGGSIGLARTSPMHISTGRDNSIRVVEMKTTYETSPDGNNVSLEEQMVNMNQNSLKHQEIIGLKGKMGAMLKVAIGENR